MGGMERIDGWIHVATVESEQNPKKKTEIEKDFGIPESPIEFLWNWLLFLMEQLDTRE